MKIIFTLLFTTISLSIYSQTKLISYKSHSGNMRNFSADAIDIGEGNLGMIPQRLVRTAKLDSVIYVNKDESILITSSTCKTRFGEESKWKPGREVVHNSKLFSSKNIDSVKTVLKEQYNFQNNIDDVIFSGFPKTSDKEIRKIKRAKKEALRNKKSTTENSKKNRETPYYIGLLLMTSLAGVYSWKKNKK